MESLKTNNKNNFLYGSTKNALLLFNQKAKPFKQSVGIRSKVLQYNIANLYLLPEQFIKIAIKNTLDNRQNFKPIIKWEDQPTGFNFKSLVFKAIKEKDEKHYKYIDKRTSYIKSDLNAVVEYLYAHKKITKNQHRKFKRYGIIPQTTKEHIQMFYNQVTKPKRVNNIATKYEKDTQPLNIDGLTYSVKLKTYVSKLKNQNITYKIEKEFKQRLTATTKFI